MSATPETNAGCSVKTAYNVSKNDVENKQAAIGHRMEPNGAQRTLENLPSELRAHVLCSIGDLRTLRSLVHSSPIYHEQYRLDRDKILKRCLDIELNGFYIDAFATVKSRVSKLGKERTDEVITTFLCSYIQCLSGPRDSLSAASIAMSMKGSDLRWLSRFHQSIIVPLTELFCHWAFTNLARAVESSGNAIQGEPAATSKMELSLISDSERIRVMRALYRFQIHCHLFGRNRGTRVGAFLDREIIAIFFNIFQPWEREEIGCIELFIQTKYTHIFNQVKADLHPTSPRFYDQRDLEALDSDGFEELLNKVWEGWHISITPTPLGHCKYSMGD